jgi:hypothetical protein
MQLVYMKMYERYMKRDWVMLKPGMAVNRQALMMSMSDKDIQKFQKTIEKTQIDVQNQILSLRNMRRSDANLRRQGLKPQQTLSKTKK